MDLSFIWTIIFFVLIFSFIVIGHEGGHFLVARINGIHVVEFTIGLGPKLLHFKIKDTEFSLRLLPFGGACIFENPDEADDEDEKKEAEEKLVTDIVPDKNSKAFKDASVWARIATVVAGPLFNVILAYFLGLFIVFFCGEVGTTISSVTDGMPAQEAGLMAGDKIIKINGERIYLFDEIKLLSYIDNHEQWTIEYERNGERYETVVTPTFVSSTTRIIGIASKDVVDCSNIKMFKYSLLEIRFWVKATFKSLRMLVTGRLTKDDVSGPVGMAQIIDTTIEDTKEYGTFTVILNMINITLLLSVNLGIMNLLPLPALDGGRLIFLLFEAVTRKQVPRKFEAFVHGIGIIALLILSVFILINDITKFFR